MVGDADVENVGYNSYCTISVSIFNLQDKGRHLTSPIHWGPPDARLGLIASPGDASDCAFNG